MANWHVSLTNGRKLLLTQKSLIVLRVSILNFPHSLQRTWAPNGKNLTSSLIIEAEIQKLLDKGVIVPTQHEGGEYISPICVANKKDGSYRMILNLKSFNQHVEYQHFKMDSVWTAIRLMTPNCYMASVDLKDAYYSVPIAKPHQKYLKFELNNMLFQFTCFPNGLAFCPRKFTKLMKPVFAILRQLGHLSSGYIDDSWLMGPVWDDCAKNVVDTVRLLDTLRFVVHPEKSVFIPTQKLVFLDFILDSVSMLVYLTPEKALKLKQAATDLFNCKNPTIREVAKVLGLIVSSFPGVAYGPLHYRYLKPQLLKLANGTLMPKCAYPTKERKSLSGGLTQSSLHPTR